MNDFKTTVAINASNETNAKMIAYVLNNIASKVDEKQLLTMFEAIKKDENAILKGIKTAIKLNLL